MVPPIAAMVRQASARAESCAMLTPEMSCTLSGDLTSGLRVDTRARYADLHRKVRRRDLNDELAALRRFLRFVQKNQDQRLDDFFRVCGDAQRSGGQLDRQLLQPAIHGRATGPGHLLHDAGHLCVAQRTQWFAPKPLLQAGRIHQATARLAAARVGRRRLCMSSGIAQNNDRADNHEAHVERGRTHRQLIRRKERHQEAEHHADEADACNQPHAEQCRRAR